MKTAESVCSVLGFKLANSWETYVTELPKFPWTSMYLTSLELDTFAEFVQAEQLQVVSCMPFIMVQIVS